MNLINVGRSGLRVSAVGLGCNNFGWRIGVEQSRPIIHRALDLGITLFDTANMYGDKFGDSEAALGEILAGHRQNVVLATKFGLTDKATRDSSRGFVLKSLEDSLKRLRTDWVDLYMIHWPDPKTPIEETVRVLNDIVASGKARYIACSNVPSWQIVEAQWLAKEMRGHAFIASQNEYSLLARSPESELIPALQKYGMSLSPYFPLASGMLSGKYLNDAQGRLKSNWIGLGDRFLTPRNIEVVRKLDAYARERGHTLLELAMSWLACQPVVAGIIAGATSANQVEQNAVAVDWKLTSEDRSQIDAITK